MGENRNRLGRFRLEKKKTRSVPRFAPFCGANLGSPITAIRSLPVCASAKRKECQSFFLLSELRLVRLKSFSPLANPSAESVSRER